MPPCSSKKQSTMHQNCDLEDIIFCSVFASKFYRSSFDFASPTWGYVGPLDTPKTPPRRFQGASKRAPKTKCATCFAPALSLIDFGPFLFIYFFDECLIDFCLKELKSIILKTNDSFFKIIVQQIKE